MHTYVAFSKQMRLNEEPWNDDNKELYALVLLKKREVGKKQRLILAFKRPYQR